MKKLLAIMLICIMVCMSLALVACGEKEGVDDTSYKNIEQYVLEDGTLDIETVVSADGIEVELETLNKLAYALEADSAIEYSSAIYEHMESMPDYYCYAWFDYDSFSMTFETYYDNYKVYHSINYAGIEEELYYYYYEDDFDVIINSYGGWTGYTASSYYEYYDIGSYAYSLDAFVYDEDTGVYTGTATLNTDYVGVYAEYTARFIDNNTVYVVFDVYGITCYEIIVLEEQTVTLPEYTLYDYSDYLEGVSSILGL